MANTISTTIAVNDNMTSVLVKINKAVQNVTQSYAAMENASAKAAGTVSRSMNSAVTATGKIKSSIAQFDSMFSGVSSKLSAVSNSTKVLADRFTAVRVQGALAASVLKTGLPNALKNLPSAAISAVENAILRMRIQAARARYDIENIGSTLKTLPTKAVTAVKNGLTAVQMQASLSAAALKTFAKVKLNSTVSKLNEIRTALTQGRTGAAGFATALKNIGKITVVGAVNSVNRLKNALAQTRTGVTGVGTVFKSLGTTITNTAKNGVNAFKNFASNMASSIKSKVGEIKSALNQVSVGVAAITAAAGVAVKKIADYSDTVIQTKARLDLMNDGLQTTQELQQKIYDSATRARGAYQSTADAVSKMGILAGNAFSSNDEIIAFMEQVNKQFTISGTSAEGVQAAMLQLTQAMGSGMLRGEELNSVLEQAPTIVQTIAKYLGTNVGTLREMAKEGQITSEVVKTALLSAADETNAKFESMPKTFSQIWADFKNRALFAFQPVLEKINELASTGRLDTMIEQATNTLTQMGNAALSVFTWLSEHGEIVKAALIGVGIAITGMTVAMWAFNIAAMANPVVWIVLAIIAGVALLAAGIYLLVKHWEEVSAAAGRCWEAIQSFFGGIGAWFKGIWDTVVSAVQSAWNAVVLAVQNAWNGIKSVFSAVGGWFAGVWNGVVSIAQSVWNGVVSVLSSVWNTIWGVISPIVTAIWNLISSVFGAIASIIGAVMQGIWATIQRVWNSVVSFITPILQAIWTAVTTIWNNIWTAITTVCTSIWNTVVSIWNNITSAVSTAVNAVLSAVSSIWNTIRSVTSSIWNSIKSRIADIWKGIVSAVTNKAKEVYDKIKGKFEEILDFLGGLKDKMIAKGKEIIQGLIDGIASKINAVADKIRSVGETITNGIKNFFDIGSPSKVMRELGQWTFEGFNVGLLNMIDKIRRTTVNMGEVVTRVMPVPDRPKEPQGRPSEFAAMRQVVSNRSSSYKTINAPVTVKVDNNNSFTSEADISRFTRRLANGIAEQIGVQLEGAMA